MFKCLIFDIFTFGNKKEVTGVRFLNGLLSNILKTINNEDFRNRSRVSSADFVRKRKFCFKDLLVSLIGFNRPSVQTELDRFFKAVSKEDPNFKTISKSAFTQSRKKLKHEAFIELNNKQLSYFKEKAPNQLNWKNKRVVAIDGSLLNLPQSDEIKEAFGFAKNQHEEIISGRCSFAYDVCNKLVLSASIAPYKSCEKELAASHLSDLNPDTDILVFDRGYPAFWLLGLLVREGFQFCFRLSSSWKDAVGLADSDEDDRDWSIKRKSIIVPETLKNYNLPNEISDLRLVSVKLSSGKKEILATNLTDRTEFPVKTMKQLYHLRWGVEEEYKTFKKVLHIEHFTGKTVHSVRQDFYAKILMLNLSSIIGSQGVNIIKPVKKKKRKYQTKLNRTQLLAKTKDFLIDLFYSENIVIHLKQIVRILASRLDIIRPNRSFPRNHSKSRRRVKTLNYKGI